MRAVSIAAMAVGTASAANNPAYKWGHATYTYGPLLCEPDNVCAVVPSCNRAGFAPDIEEFNTATETTTDDFSTILSYGGDIEFWSGKGHPDGCARNPYASTDPTVCNVSVYFDPNNLKAAQAYSEVQGVKSITALLDSRMDGWEQIKTYDDNDYCQFGNFYPDLRNLSNVSMQKLADDAAKLYCANDIIDGIQVDLEPYHDPYTESLNQYVSPHLCRWLRPLALFPRCGGLADFLPMWFLCFASLCLFAQLCGPSRQEPRGRGQQVQLPRRRPPHWPWHLLLLLRS